MASKKITSFDGISIGAGATFTSGTFKGSANNIITLPSTTGTLATLGGTETLTGKTLTSPVISSITNGNATITLPSTTGTLATIAGTETLTNKTLTEPTIATIKNGAATITVPSTSGTLALASEMNDQKGRIDRLLDYLEGWIGVGNVNMNDIKDEVDPAS